MKGKKHKPEQIIKKLREAEAMISAAWTLPTARMTKSSSGRRVIWLKHQ